MVSFVIILTPWMLQLVFAGATPDSCEVRAARNLNEWLVETSPLYSYKRLAQVGNESKRPHALLVMAKPRFVMRPLVPMVLARICSFAQITLGQV